MTIVLTWTTFKWVVIPIVLLLLFGLTGMMPDNPYLPGRVAFAKIGGVLLLVWLIIFFAHGFLT